MNRTQEDCHCSNITQSIYPKRPITETQTTALQTSLVLLPLKQYLQLCFTLPRVSGTLKHPHTHPAVPAKINPIFPPKFAASG